ncbi:hypothetical protein MHYP_G00018120 [Metynnis hypsauchen]
MYLLSFYVNLNVNVPLPVYYINHVPATPNSSKRSSATRCCLIPCAKGPILRLIDSAVTKVMLYETITTEEPGYVAMLPLERSSAMAPREEVDEPNL